MNYKTDIIDRIKQIIKNNKFKYSVLIKKDKELTQYINDYFLNFKEVPNNLKEKLYWVIHNLKDFPKCKICGKNNTKFKNIFEGYKLYCSGKCANKDINVKNKIKNTFLNKYGVDNPSKDEKVKEKRDKTVLLKYGVNNVFQNSNIKEKINKNMLEKYGYIFALQNKGLKEKMIITKKNKYGNAVGITFDLKIDYKKNIKDILQQVVNKYKTNYILFIKNDVNLLNRIDKYFIGLNDKPKLLKEKIYWIIRGIKSFPMCNTCQKNKTKFKNIFEGYNSYCSKICSTNNERRKEKMKNTMLEKYGCIFALQNKDLKEKMNIKKIKSYLKNISEKVKLYNISNISINTDGTVNFLCNKCDKKNKNIDKHFIYNRITYYNLSPCIYCHSIHNQTSGQEKELLGYIKSIYKGKILVNQRILDGKEIDIYLPELKVGIEYNGLYWHSLNGGNKTKDYHYNKFLIAKKKGIKLIQVFSDDWNINKEIVKNRLKNIVSKGINIGARKTIIKEINKKIGRDFLNKYHLQGAGKNSIYYGVYYLNKLISVITFSKPNISKGSKKNGNNKIMELNRFVSLPGYSISGIVAKVSKKYMKDYNIDKIYTYADLRYGDGAVYLKNGFNFIKHTGVNYWYVDKTYTTRYYRFNYQKNKLQKIFNLDYNEIKEKNEKEIMFQQGYDIIYDCGHYKFEYTI